MKAVICSIGSLLAAASFASGELPEGYKAVEYIESTKGGGQFIDTGYTANGQTRKGLGTSMYCVKGVSEKTLHGSVSTDSADVFGRASGVQGSSLP